MEEAESLYHIIRAWWLSSGTPTKDNIRPLNDWLAFGIFNIGNLEFLESGLFLFLPCNSVLCSVACIIVDNAKPELNVPWQHPLTVRDVPTLGLEEFTPLPQHGRYLWTGSMR